MNIVKFYRSQNLDPFEISIPLTFHINSLQTTPGSEY